ncbi:hypothetical protein [Streptomyces sp. LUP30]|uniref:hypothetical protein n=1 Tax=Streptomyces sp. LUP30 TaxID=1890285 RepID=UPI000851605D|nr:hypothetical protein [Streptomyces sp. LUP30]
MTTFTAPAIGIDKNLDTACAAVTSEINRTDGEASLFFKLLEGRIDWSMVSVDSTPCRVHQPRWFDQPLRLCHIVQHVSVLA